MRGTREDKGTWQRYNFHGHYIPPIDDNDRGCTGVSGHHAQCYRYTICMKVRVAISKKGGKCDEGYSPGKVEANACTNT